jgi:hypothetical protein
VCISAIQYYLRRLFCKCHNLKVLEFNDYNHYDDVDFLADRPSFWKAVNFKLKKLVITECIFSTDETFIDFLKSQTDLETVSLLLDDNVEQEVLETLQTLPLLGQINIKTSCRRDFHDTTHWCCEAFQCQVVVLSSIPHHKLEKFRFWSNFFTGPLRPLRMTSIGFTPLTLLQTRKRSKETS